MSEPFANVIDNETELRDGYRMPADSTKMKLPGSLDQHARTFIEAAPFLLVGTTSPDGTAGVSPKGWSSRIRGGARRPPRCHPRRLGQNQLDSLTNIVNGSGIGLLFLVPGVDERCE